MEPWIGAENLSVVPSRWRNVGMTLGESMASGRLPMAEALRHGINLAEALRRLHDEGRVHGALSPEHLEQVNHGLELVAPNRGMKAEITRYTAPEVAEGQAPDARSDIFAFGAIVFEMATGRPAFEGEWDVPPSSGNPALD